MREGNISIAVVAHKTADETPFDIVIPMRSRVQDQLKRMTTWTLLCFSRCYIRENYSFRQVTRFVRPKRPGAILADG